MIARIAAIALLLSLAHHASAETGGMIPPAGQAFAPLPTDQPVQRGMLAIRDLVRTNHSLVTHRRMPPDHAARFAKQVKAEADGILASSKIAGDAREKLRALLDEIVAGIEAVAKPQGGRRSDGRAGARRRGAGALCERIRPPRLGAAAVDGLELSVLPAAGACPTALMALRYDSVPSDMDTRLASLYLRVIANCGTFLRRQQVTKRRWRTGKAMDQRTILIAVAVALVLGIIWYTTQTPPMTSTAPPPATTTPTTPPAP